ncbi:hypothetical protein [Flavobacterium sp.]|uniref:hypothetical protein n=1 Tax=Flavobacterium sp. TaxID=239 RepID=UPI003267964B
MTKETRIQMEWIEIGFEPLGYDYENGFIPFDELPDDFNCDLLEFQQHKENFNLNQTTTLCRPKDLQGIEDNNGWIKIESGNNIPDQGTIVIGYSIEWIDEDFNPSGQRQCHYVGIWPVLDWVSAKWLDYQDTWLNDERTEPTHWRPIIIINSPLY